MSRSDFLLGPVREPFGSLRRFRVVRSWLRPWCCPHMDAWTQFELGWRAAEGTRPSRYCNHYTVSQYGREISIVCFQTPFRTKMDLRSDLWLLSGLRLVSPLSPFLDCVCACERQNITTLFRRCGFCEHGQILWKHVGNCPIIDLYIYILVIPLYVLC